MALKDIELDSQRATISDLQHKMKGNADRIQSLQFDLEQAQEAYISLNRNVLDSQKEHAYKVNEIKK